MTLLQQILAVVGSHDWIALAVLLIGLVQAWLSSDSAFPVTISDRWKAVVTVALGQVYAVMIVVQAHQPWVAAAVHGLATSLIVLLTSHAIWSQNAPAWVKWLAMFLQEVSDTTDDKAKSKGPAE